ncbi:MAG: AAA family ATPase [Candidatus Hydrogenedentes bacterium]|nr:AAA family ATPase [Candidatus Hydrogenedentota bacterium]
MTTEFSTELSAFAQQGGGGRAGERGLDLKRLIRLRLPLMVMVFIACAVPTVLAAWFMVPLEYEARALIRFLEKREAVLRGGDMGTRSNYEQFVQTQVRLISGSPILPRVLDDPEVRALPLLADSDDPLATLEGKVYAQLNPKTELVTVSCRAKERETALVIVREIVTQYMNFALGQEQRVDDEVVKALLKEEQETEQQLNTLRETINLRKKNSGIALLADGNNAVAAESQTYHENLSAAQTDLLRSQAESAQLEQFIAEIEALQARCQEHPDEPIHEHGVERLLAEDRGVAVLIENLASIENELARLQEIYQEGHKQLRLAEQAREVAESTLAEAKREARASVLKSLLEQYRLELEVARGVQEGAQARVEEFQKKIAASEARAMEISQFLADLELMENSVEELEEHLGRVRSRLRDKSVESNAPANIQVASEAHAGEHPDYGRRLKAMLLALVGSMCVGAGIGVLRELTDQEVRTAQDLSYLTDLPLLAVVPHSSMDRLPKQIESGLLTADHPDTTSADEFRRVLTRIIYPPEGSAELNTCLIASPSRGDGKTSLACNLAVALAHANRRVLLLDLSTRRPDVARRFGLEPGPGLSEVLAGEYEPSAVVQTTRFPNLHVMGPGSDREEVIGKLASRETIEFLEKAEDAYEHVVIDTPPSLLMSDAKLLAPVVDGVVLVIGAGISTAGMVRRCVNELRQINANLVGVVLNGVKQTPGGYLSENLKSYYAYSMAGEEGIAGRARAIAAPDAEDMSEPTIMLVDDEETDDDAE